MQTLTVKLLKFFTTQALVLRKAIKHYDLKGDTKHGLIVTHTCSAAFEPYTANCHDNDDEFHAINRPVTTMVNNQPCFSLHLNDLVAKRSKMS